MAGINGEKIKIVPYDTRDIDFVEPVKDALGLSEADDLADLHSKFENDILVTRETDSKTPIHKRYYENIENTDFYDRYKKFLHTVVSELVDGPLIVQKIPSFRVHLPNNKAVGQYHRDSDFGHQSGAINFWVPVTPAFDSNTIHVVSDESGNPSSISVDVGEALAFDAMGLLHGNEINTTPQTRVSFDFRVIPEQNYSESNETSVNTMTRLALGGYYVNADQL